MKAYISTSYLNSFVTVTTDAPSEWDESVKMYDTGPRVNICRDILQKYLPKTVLPKDGSQEILAVEVTMKPIKRRKKRTV